jgi:uncharacterized protein
MVHTYKMNGYGVAVDGNSGAIHLLDDLSYRMLCGNPSANSVEELKGACKGKYPPREADEVFEELGELEKGGLLFSDDSYLNDLPQNHNKILKSICLHVAHDCNMRCEYCFASQGDYQTGRRLMSLETACQAVDFLIRNSGKIKNIEIDFFGGEPLLNFSVVKQTIEYARSIQEQFHKNFYFTITTNGVLLDDEKIRFINEYMDNVVISIDGRKKVHDAIRYDRAGNGTYDNIVPKAQKLVKGRNGKSYFIRGTYTARNLDFSNDVRHLASLGFKEISVEPVVGEGRSFDITGKDIAALLEEYERFAVEYIDRAAHHDYRFYHFSLDLYGGPCIYKRISACGAGNEYLAVSPTGELYPCHQFVGEPEFKIGDLNSGVTRKDIAAKFASNNILHKEKCKNCWAKLFCSGGCHANAWFTNGDISVPNEIACTLQKKRIECAIMIQCALSEGKQNIETQ